MAQWGEERTFTRGENKVRAVPNVNTGPDPVQKIGKGGPDVIDRLVIIHMDGPERAVLERMAVEIKAHFSGALYETWAATPISGPVPEAHG